MRINLTIEEKLLKEFDTFCETYHYDRSELIRELMRKNIYPNLVLSPLKIEVPKTSTPTIEIGTPDLGRTFTGTMPIENKESKEVRVSKGRDLIAMIEKQSKAPKVCPKHGNGRMGNSYTCGCSI